MAHVIHNVHYDLHNVHLAKQNLCHLHTSDADEGRNSV